MAKNGVVEDSEKALLFMPLLLHGKIIIMVEIDKHVTIVHIQYKH